MTRPLVRAVFALLVLATIAAFLVTQQLKSEFPLVLRFAVQPMRFSPNGDGVRDRVRLGFDLTERAKIRFSVMDSEGNEVRRIVDDRELGGSTKRSIKHRFWWNGRDDAGHRVPDGVYRMRVVRRDEDRVIDSFKEITVDTRPPRVRMAAATPGVIAPGEPGQRPRVKLSYDGPPNQAPEFRVFRTDDGPPRVVLRFRGKGRSGVWDGRLRDRRPAAPGDYAFTVRVRDHAGNEATAPAAIPTLRIARPGTGVSVRPLTLRGPLSVTPAGGFARLEVGPFDRSFEFALSRLGEPRPLKTGKRIAGKFRVRIPRDALTGVYLVRVRAGDRRAVWPVAVAGLPGGRKKAAGRPRPLVVLPVLTWQALNPVDDDLDGFADTFPSARRIRLDREFAGGAPPAGLVREASPLLRFLDRARLPYDLTTDLALARGEGPALGNAPGVAIAGSAVWLPASLEKRLRDYVDGGGRLVSFGADALRRNAKLAGEVLADPSPPAARNVFGERTGLVRTGPAPLSVSQDDLGLFEGLSSLIGDFTVFERSLALPAGTDTVVAAGRDAEQPALVGFKRGDGLFLRMGTPQWASDLNESQLSTEVQDVTKRVWSLLTEG